MRAAAQVEFEIRDAELALLAARKVERPAPRTAIRLAVDLAEAGIIDDVTAVGSISALDIETLLHPQLQLTGDEAEFARGLPAAAGAAVGRIALSSEQAVDWSEKSDPVILVAEETSPGDLPGMLAAKAHRHRARRVGRARGGGRPGPRAARGLRRYHAADRPGRRDGDQRRPVAGRRRPDLGRRQQRDHLRRRGARRPAAARR